MVYFISGHKDLTEQEFNEIYVPKIENVLAIDDSPVFIMGDNDGVDTYAMDYLFSHRLEPKMYICTISSIPQNLPEDYIKFFKDNPEVVTNFGIISMFKSNIERDIYMTKHSDFDIAYVKNDRWNSGTAQNIRRRHDISRK